MVWFCRMLFAGISKILRVSIKEKGLSRKRWRESEIAKSSTCFLQLPAVFNVPRCCSVKCVFKQFLNLHNTDFQIYLFMTGAYCVMEIM